MEVFEKSKRCAIDYGINFFFKIVGKCGNFYLKKMNQKFRDIREI